MFSLSCNGSLLWPKILILPRVSGFLPTLNPHSSESKSRRRRSRFTISKIIAKLWTSIWEHIPKDGSWWLSCYLVYPSNNPRKEEQLESLLSYRQERKWGMDWPDNSLRSKDLNQGHLLVEVFHYRNYLVSTKILPWATYI